MTGAFADPAITQYVYPGLTGAYFGNVAELGWQALAAVVVIVYAFLVSYFLLKLIGVITPLRESDDKLRVGDLAIHGEIGEDLEE